MEESNFHSANHPEKAMYGKHKDYDLLKNTSLEECAQYLIAGKLKHDTFWNQWQPQVNWITDEQGKILVDFIGYTEKINEDYAAICEKINIPFKLPEKLNSSILNNQHYSIFYNQRTREMIANYYQEDIKMFNYKF